MSPAFPFVLALMMSLGPMALAAAEVPNAPLNQTSARPLRAEDDSEFTVRTGTLRVPALRSLAMVAGG